MNTFVRLIKTDSYFNIFDVLSNEVKKLSNNIDDKTLVFCEEKISLLAEGSICNAINGSFSINVYSFGNYLRQRLTSDKVLSKEGSTMALRRILKSIPLKCFVKSRQGLSSSVYNLIALLKSAKITVNDIFEAINNSKGVLKNKLCDIYEIYKGYEEFIGQNGYDDQSSVLSYLPKIISEDKTIKNTDIILLGYTSWTKQIVSIVDTLFKCAKSITVITTSGDNNFAFVNEIEGLLSNICLENNVSLIKENILSPYNTEARIICENMFNPKSFSREQTLTEKVININAENDYDQIEKVAEIIKSKVIEGYRYSDFSIAVNDGKKIEYNVQKIFSKLEIPYFLDVKKNGKNTALVSLILSYIEIFRKNFERENVIDFIKNPLFGLEKGLSDKFENYVLKYNINYKRFFTPFSFCGTDEPIDIFNSVRERFVNICSSFNIEKMLNELNVEEKQQELSVKLKRNGFETESAINDQIYNSVIEILKEMRMLIGENATVLDIKETFISGINALELSVLPQFKDAVFIGNFKEVALIQNKYIFALNLTADVPLIKEDVSILSDDDLKVLDGLKMIIEPKIKIVNHREREHLALALSSFRNGLFYCSPNIAVDGKKNIKSEVVEYLEKMFSVKTYNQYNKYLTLKQGIESFSKDCTMYADGRISEFASACNFYEASKSNQIINTILEKTNSEIVKNITVNRSLAEGVTSPTSLESYSTCPYKTFIELYLRVKDRDSGEVNPLSVGTLIHEVFEKFIKRIDEVIDKTSCDTLVSDLLNEILNRDEYSKYLETDKESATVNRIKKEVLDYSYKIYLSLVDSSFKPKYVEQRFGDDKKNSLPPINLLGGKIKLKGKIDRVDEYKDYIRIIDYKTGGIHLKKEELFSGNKLQLYLYGKVFENKKIAGAYYMPVNNSYKGIDKKEEPMLKGDTLNDVEIVVAQDKNIIGENGGNVISATVKDGEVKKAISCEKMKAFTEYAFRIAEKISERMSEGYIPASPLNDICEYCSFNGICDDRICQPRTILKVDDDVIEKSVKGDEE